jgi:hypothetical protein
MLAARNRWFRIAAALAGVSWLLLAALELIDAIHALEATGHGGYKASAVLFFAAHAVGLFGWILVAAAFDGEVDWRRLRLGATVVATTYLVYAVGWVPRLLALLGETHDADFRGYYIASTIGTLAFAAGACVAASGVADRRKGASRAARLQVGAALIFAASIALTVGELSLQAFYSEYHAVHEMTLGALLGAVGTFITAAAALVFAAGARRPLLVRERAVVGASVVTVVATACLAAGEFFIALAYSTHGVASWEQAVAWLAVAGRVALVPAFAAVALGASNVRSAFGGARAA